MGKPDFDDQNPHLRNRPAAIPTGPIHEIASFRPGVWNGKPYSAAFVQQLHDNFQKYCTGSSPYYRPYISLDHQDVYRFGNLTDSRLRGGVLYFDAGGVPLEIHDQIKAGMLHDPSVEFIEPKRDASGRPVEGFEDAAGKVIDGPMMKCLTFLGNDIPGVKGLPPLSSAKFSHRTGTVSPFRGGILLRFGSSAMDRAAMLQFLTEQGFDVSGITDVVPDAVVAAIVDYVKSKNTNPAPTPTPAPDNTPNPQQMADQLAALAGTGAAGGTGGTGGTGAVPSQVLVKFNQQFPGLMGSIAGTLTTIQRNAATIQQAQAAQLNAVRAERISTFLHRMGEEGKVTPAMRPAVVALLEKCDVVKVSKFSHDATKTGSEFDAMCDLIASTYPVVVKFNQRQNTSQPPLKPPTTHGGSGGGIDKDRRARILGGSPVGRTVLANDGTTGNK